jgi:uncharacterized integral membrane protein
MAAKSAENSGHGTQEKKIGTGRLIAIIAVAALAALFVLQNFQSVPVKFLTFEFDLPLWLVMVVLFVLGMVLGGAVRSGVRKLRGAPPKPKD